MEVERTPKLQKLLEMWPMHTIVTMSWLTRQGYSHTNIQKYISSNWIESVGAGAYKRPHDTVPWEGAVYGLQQQHPDTFYVGGKTALEKQGSTHYMSFSQTPLFLFTSLKKNLPCWFKNFTDNINIPQYNFHTKLLSSEIGLTFFDCGDFKIKISSRERAALEMAALASGEKNIGVRKHSFEECLHVFENLSTLRPQIIQELLEKSSSVKAKRIFLFLGDKLNLPWMKQLNFSCINLGEGPRQLTVKGIYNSKYNITYPKDLFENDTLNV